MDYSSNNYHGYKYVLIFINYFTDCYQLLIGGTSQICLSIWILSKDPLIQFNSDTKSDFIKIILIPCINIIFITDSIIFFKPKSYILELLSIFAIHFNDLL